MSSRPNQKMGMEIPKRAPIMLRLSKREYCLVEEMTPAIRPMKPAIRMERKESWIVKRKRSFRSLVTGSRFLIEIPKSPRTTWVMKLIVLNVEGLVQTVVAPDLFDEFGVGLLSGEKHGRVSGDHMEQGKGDQGNPEEDRKEHENSFGNVAWHLRDSKVRVPFRSRNRYRKGSALKSETDSDADTDDNPGAIRQLTLVYFSR